MVSRYLVDVIVIVGLIFGTTGVFFMAQGLLGRRVTALLQGAVVAVPYAILYALALGYFADAIAPIFNLPLPSILVGRVFGAVAGLFWAFLTVAFNKAVRRGLDSIFDKSDKENRRFVIGLVLQDMRDDVWQPSLFLALLGAGVVTAIAAVLLHLPAVPLIIYVTTVDSLAFSAIIAAWLATGLSSRQLQLIGLVLTLIGIGTQFVQPILDLLNIKPT